MWCLNLLPDRPAPDSVTAHEATDFLKEEGMDAADGVAAEATEQKDAESCSE